MRSHPSARACVLRICSSGFARQDLRSPERSGYCAERSRANLPHLSAFAAAYTLELIIWNFPPTERFLFPLIPLLVAGAVCEAENVIRLFRPKLLRWSLRSAFAAACCGGLLWQSPQAYTGIIHQLKTFDGMLQNRQLAYLWISQHLPAGSTLVAYDDPGMLLYTGHEALRNEPLPGPYIRQDRSGILRPISTIADFARQHGAQYVFWSPDDYAIDGVLRKSELREQALKQNRGLKLVYDGRNVRIYAVD
jgi:hypothetical protein